MFRNYLTIAYRNLLRYKAFSLINILGLAIGLACCLLIAMWVKDELSFDRFHEYHARIYRLNVDVKWEGNHIASDGVPLPMGPALQQSYPAIQSFTRISIPNKILISYEDKHLFAENLLYVDSTFLDIFSFPVIYGNTETALNGQGVVITEELAEKIFGSPDKAIGKVLQLKEVGGRTVTAVLNKLPGNSHLQFDALISMPSMPGFSTKSQQWGQFNYPTYVLLQKGFNVKQLEGQMDQFYHQYVAAGIGDDGSVQIDFSILFQPLTGIHFHSTHLRRHKKGARMAYVYAFSGIALFMLIIACINYMNLSTARSLRRAKEVGIRKVAGSSRTQLIGQYLAESLFITLIAIIISLTLVQMSLPLFNRITGKTISLFSFIDGYSLLAVIGIALLTGLLSGSYPAFILSGYQPVQVLKGGLKSTPKGVWIRKGLVVFQFALSACMVIGTMVVYQQLGYMRKQSLGFEQDQVLTVKLEDKAISAKADVLKNKLEAYPEITGVAFSNHFIGQSHPSIKSFFFLVEGQSVGVTSEYFFVSHDYISVLGIEVKEGRNFNRTNATDAEAVLINETLAKRLGVSSALGIEVIEVNGSDEAKYRVIGVMSDFHVNSLHNSIEPLLIRLTPEKGEYVYVKANPQHLERTKAHIAEAYDQLKTDYPLELGFLDQAFARQYEEDERKSTLFLTFAILTIGIACLGLFGLAAFSMEQRTKEISIRKVLGASVSGLVNHLSMDFLKLIILANLIAWPVAWFCMQRWLQDFPYRIQLNIGLFIVACCLTLGIAFVTIVFQTLKAALANPINSLRNE